VDYKLRCGLLHEMESLSVAQVMERIDDGLPKLWTISHALHLRRERPEWFGEESGYRPLRAIGSKKAHVIAYLRGDNVITVVPRLVITLAGKWANTAVALPKGRWTNRLTGETIEGGKAAMEDLLREFPVALLVREENEQANRSE
jgi:(1->4)-alpha-D-glucan 1-alpha-D-glucosylmutase